MIVFICIFTVLFVNIYFLFLVKRVSSLAKRIEGLEEREKARASKESFYNVEGRLRGLEEQVRSRMIKIIDLFAGIGGFHLAFHKIGAECVFASEIDKFARKTYEENFKNISPKLFSDGFFNEDITKIDAADIPDFDVLCAGFPCQPFSQTGLKRGFDDSLDSRGNMFFEIVRILKVKKPRAFFLENVRGLPNHNAGETFKIIKETLENCGYSFHSSIIRASDFGLPQHRPRLYIVGFANKMSQGSSFMFPAKRDLEFTMSDIWGGNCNKKIGYTLRVGGKGSGINDRRNWDCYIVNGIEIKLSFKEAKKMMGLPENFIFPVSNTQAMKQLGNSVAINVVEAIARKIIDQLINKCIIR